MALAERLDFGWAAVVTSIELDRSAGVARVHRELEGGLEELTDLFDVVPALVEAFE